MHCTIENCGINTVVFNDVIIDSFKSSDLVILWGAVFNKTKLQGNNGRIMFSPYYFPGGISNNKQAMLDQANRNFYEKSEWALDISEGSFIECDIRHIPTKLIIRDPKTQVIIRREVVLKNTWKNLDLSKTYWKGVIELFIADGDVDTIIVAPKRHPKYKDLLDGLKILRDAGVAEPD